MSTNVKSKERQNVHIDYNLMTLPFHTKVAQLVSKYSKSKDSTLLDIGCGAGNTIQVIQEMNPDMQIFASDIDLNCLEITSKRANITEAIHIDDVEDLFNKGKKFDIVVMSHVLEHVKRPYDTVQGIIDILKPGGFAILAVPNPVRPRVIFGNLFKVHYVNRGHVYAWDRSTWMNFLENIVKADVVEYTQDALLLPALWKVSFLHPFLKFLSKVFPWFSMSHIAVIKK